MQEYKEPEERIKLLTELFDKFNCDYLGLPTSGDMRTRSIRFRKCGHEQSVVYHNLLKIKAKNGAHSGPVCENCRLAARQVLLDKFNFTLIEQKTKDKWLVRRTCGHETIVYRHHISASNDLPCRPCNHETHLATCNQLNLTYISSHSNPTKANYRFNCCGLEKEMYKVAVDRGNILCPNCDQSWMAKKSLLYLLKINPIDAPPFLKFGYGKAVRNRVKEYRLKNCEGVNLLYSVKISSGFSARVIEENIHKELKNKLDPQYARMYLTKGGFTECYPVSQLSIILSKMQKIERDSCEQ